MDILKLKAVSRIKIGKSVAELRAQGSIPAVIYGPDTENVLISLFAKDCIELFKKASENPIIEILVGDDKPVSYRVLVQEIRRDPVSQEVEHIDFYRFSATKKVHIDVPIDITGVAPAVADLGGVLLQNLDKIEVECLPDAIPQQFIVDISGLNSLNDTIYVESLVMPKGVVCHLDPHTPIVSITEPEKEEIAPVAPTAPAEILTEAEAKRKEAEQEAQEDSGEKEQSRVCQCYGG